MRKVGGTPVFYLHVMLFVFGRWAWSEEPLHYQIVEEVPAGTILGNVKHDASLNTKYDKHIADTLSFSFLSNSGLHAKFFIINARDGTLLTKSTIDRDAICPNQLRCEIAVNIAVRPARYFQIIYVLVEVLDTNDNAPSFPRKNVKLVISESRAPGIISVFPAAQDPDGGHYAIQGYDLKSDHNKFAIRVSKSQEGNEIQLHLKQMLDREQMDSFKLTIIAYDGGSPRKSGTAIVEIRVSDINDNNPKFLNNSYDVLLPENAPAKQSIVRVKAIDPDEALNGQIVYSFSRLTLKTYGKAFGINSETGDIYLKGALNYRLGPKLHLTVFAQDRGPDSIPARTEITVHIQDINDHAPHITINTLNPSGEASVQENAQIGTFVAFASVIDQDGGKNAEFDCSLQDRNFDLKLIQKSTYKIITAAKLDKELKTKLELTLSCMDHGNPPLSSKQIIPVSILDENDNAPMFSQKVLTARLRENNRRGDYVIRINATDRDSGKNGEINFSLYGKSKRQFNINKRTGVITAKTSFDREEEENVQIYVIARDRGEPPLSSTATVVVTLADVNDCKPEFTQPDYTFGIFENQPPGTEVGRVFATDSDSFLYNKFTFSLQEFMEQSGIFMIDSITGKITTQNVLDRENQSVYEVTVLVTDSLAPHKYSKANVSIYVADKNDNSPTIKFPNDQNNTVYISKLMPVGYTVTRIEACDRDSGSNAWLKYYIKGNNNPFSSDRNTGIITLDGDIKGLPEGHLFYLIVSVRDSGQPSHSAESGLNILINESLVLYEPNSLSTAVHNIFEDNILFLALCGGLGFMLLVLVIVFVIIIRRQCANRRTRGYMSGNLVRIPYSEPEVDVKDQHMQLQGRDWRREVRALNMQYSVPGTPSTNKTEVSKEVPPPPVRTSPNGQEPQYERTGTVTRRNHLLSAKSSSNPHIAELRRVSSSPAHSGRNSNTHGRVIYNRAYGVRSSASAERILERRLPPRQELQADRDTDSVCSADVSNSDSCNGLSDAGSSSTLKPSDSENFPVGSQSTLKPPRTSRKRERGRRNSSVMSSSTEGGETSDNRGSQSTTDDNSSDSNQFRVALVHPQRSLGPLLTTGEISNQVSPSDSCHGYCGSCQGDRDTYHGNTGARHREVQSDFDTSSNEAQILRNNEINMLESPQKVAMENTVRKRPIGDSSDNEASSESYVDDTDFYEQNEEYGGRDILV